jgi:single-strand DNA-binding protein
VFTSITIIGNLGTNPEIRKVGEQNVTNFSVAANMNYTNRNTGQKETQVWWFRVAVWGAQAEPCKQYLEKGRMVHIVGRLSPIKSGQPGEGTPRLWTGTDGIVRSSYEVRATTVNFLGGSNGNGGGHVNPEEASTEDEIPF